MEEKKTATITIYKYYFKSIELEVEEEYLTGLSDQEIADKIINGDIPYNEEAIDNTSLNEYEPKNEENTDRYDIYSEEGDHTFGGHL